MMSRDDPWSISHRQGSDDFISRHSGLKTTEIVTTTRAPRLWGKYPTLVVPIGHASRIVRGAGHGLDLGGNVLCIQ